LAKSKYTVEKENILRRMVKDALELEPSRSHFYLAIEADITSIYAKLQKKRREGNPYYGMSAFFMFCYIKTLLKYPVANSRRLGADRIVKYHTVDIFMPVEKKVDEELILYPSMIRNADSLNLEDLSKEFWKLSNDPVIELSKVELTFLKLPRVFRRAYYKWAKIRPQLSKVLFGTSAFSTISMYGNGSLWGYGLPFHTVSVYIGNSKNKVELSGTEAANKKYVDIVFAFDHRTLDGAQGARIVNYFRGLIERENSDIRDYLKNL